MNDLAICDHLRMIGSRHLRLRGLQMLCLVMFCACLAACGDGMRGTYVDPLGVRFKSIEFRPAGKAFITGEGGGTGEATYRKDGDKIILETRGGTLVLTIDKDGSLNAGDWLQGMHFTRKK